MLPEALGQQRNPDEQQERQRQHLDRRVLVDEVRDLACRQHHHAHGEHHRHDHHLNVLGHSDRSNHGVEREHDVEQQNLEDDRAERERFLTGVGAVLLALQSVVDFGGGLVNEERAAEDQDDVAPRDGGSLFGENAEIGQVKQRVGERHHPRDREEQREPPEHGEGEADGTRTGLLVGRQLVRQDRDEHDVVDAQYDFHRGERDERGEARRLKDNGKVHGERGLGVNGETYSR